MRRMAVVNMKGGVGKTTTAIHLAAGMAARGRRVLLVDADPQGNVSHTLSVHPPKTLENLMTGSEPDEVIVRGVRPGLDVIASTPAAFGLEARLAGEPLRETILSRRLRLLAGYDAVVIDSSPAMNLLTYNALLFAEEIVVPVAMDLMAIIGARQTLAGVAQVRELWPERSLRILAVLPTFVNSNTHATRATLEALQGDALMGPHLFLPGVRQCLDLNYATAQHQTIWEYSPKSRAAEDYNRVLDFALAFGERGKAEHVTEQRPERGKEKIGSAAQTQAEI
jgi:chromosome partitioning protein